MFAPTQKYCVLLAGTLSCLGQVTFADVKPAATFYGMFEESKTSFDFRYRFEHVDADSADNEANASTLRSRLTFKSASYRGFSFLTEFDDVTAVGDDDYNSTGNGKSQYPVVADPEGTEVNQAYLTYAFDAASGSYGRQRILHGNQRFVGGVGWRQNEQTYDGLRANLNTDIGLTVDYAHIYKVNRIFGPEDRTAQPANHRADNHFLRLDYIISDSHSLSAFVYALDIDEDENYAAGVTVGNSSNTYGVEYTGKVGSAELTLSYATQLDAGESDLNYDTSYYLLEASYNLQGIKLKVGYEELAADGGVGFKTPYATLHKFQGWADMFLVTPADGIEDTYVGVSGAVGPIKLGAVYHEFSAESSSADFGSEMDLVATWPTNKKLSLQLKAALFDTNDEIRYRDTTKIWLTAHFKF